MTTETLQGTKITNFTGWNEFDKKTANSSLYLKIDSINMYVPVTKKSIKKLYENFNTLGMKQRFQGNITLINDGIFAQIEFNKIS